MKSDKAKPIVSDSKSDSTHNNGDQSYPGYPIYPPSQDIYSQSIEEADLNPEIPTEKKSPNEAPGTRNEKDFNDDRSGSDLDVPGSELDDEQELVGEEDEENNAYSIGGDNHNSLEENQGE